MSNRRMNFYIPEYIEDFLRKEAYEKRISMTQIVIGAVEELMNEQMKEELEGLESKIEKLEESVGELDSKMDGTN